MHIYQSTQPLVWGRLDLPWWGFHQDWHGSSVERSIEFCVAMDPDYLWLVAAGKAPYQCFPDSKCGDFIEGLWEYDVVELFLSNPQTGHYLEWNLSPNGAWWTASFSSPRTRKASKEEFRKNIQTYASVTDSSSWCSALQISLNDLRQEIDFSLSTQANVTAIMHNPKPSFFSYHALPGEIPDFHQAQFFPSIKMISLPELGSIVG